MIIYQKKFDDISNMDADYADQRAMIDKVDNEFDMTGEKLEEVQIVKEMNKKKNVILRKHSKNKDGTYSSDHVNAARVILKHM